MLDLFSPRWVGVGKCVCKEIPKSELDLDLGFVNTEDISLITRV